MTSLSGLLSKSIKKKVNFKMIWEKGLFPWQMAVRVLQCQFNHFSSVFECFSCESKCLCSSAACLSGTGGRWHAVVLLTRPGPCQGDSPRPRKSRCPTHHLLTLKAYYDHHFCQSPPLEPNLSLSGPITLTDPGGISGQSSLPIFKQGLLIM